MGTAASELQRSTTSESVGLGEGRHLALDIQFTLVLRIDAGLAGALPTEDFLLVFTTSPPAVQCIPWPDGLASDGEQSRPSTRTTLLERLDWLLRDESEEEAQHTYVSKAYYCEPMNMYVWVMSDGRPYYAHLEMDSRVRVRATGHLSLPLTLNISKGCNLER